MDNIEQSVENDLLPLIEILYDDEKKETDKIHSIVNFYGIPFIRSRSGNIFFPEDLNNEPSSEFIELIGQSIVLDRILGTGANRKDKTSCSLYALCQLSKEEVTDENCFNLQWEREKICPFKIISDNWQLKQKISGV